MAQKAYSVEAVSKNLWRESSLISDGPPTSQGLGLISQVRPETLGEAKFFIESPASGSPFPMPPSPVAGIQPESIPEAAANPIAGALAASMQQSLSKLNSDFNNRSSRGQFSPISETALVGLKDNNPIAYDRILATSPEQQSKALIAGPADDAMILIPSAQKNASAKNGVEDKANWEEVFASRRSKEGPTTVAGLRNQGNEWYHFVSQIATPPQSLKNHPRGSSAPAASTTFAPQRLLQSRNPASLTDLDSARVRKDVKAITEGPLRPFLQGKALKGSDHSVQGVNSSPKGLDAFKATFDSVNGVLKKIQDVAKGIMKAAEYIGMLGELGQFGDVLKWIGALNLPKSPADLINSLLLGKGILPAEAPPVADGICNGSGEGGLVVTKSGPEAEYLGNGMMVDVAILQKQGSGANAAPAKNTNAEVSKKPSPSASPTDEEKAEKEKTENEKSDKKDADKKEADKKEADKKEADKKEADKKEADKNETGKNNNGGKHYDSAEVEAILKDIEKKNLWESFLDHVGLGNYDFKTKDPNATFEVFGKTMSAGEFGNFIAGFAGQVNGGQIGADGVRLGGVVYDATDSLVYKIGVALGYKPKLPAGSEPPSFDFDADSWPAIEAGVRLGRQYSRDGKFPVQAPKVKR